MNRRLWNATSAEPADLINEHLFRRWQLDDYGAEGMYAAMRAVLKLHPRTTSHAAVDAFQYGEGKCFYCDRSAHLDTYRDKLNGVGPVREMHEHEDLNPCCVTCGWGEGEEPEWPCAHLVAIASALEVEL